MEKTYPVAIHLFMELNKEFAHFRKVTFALIRSENEVFNSWRS